jgi:hypothetical protein
MDWINSHGMILLAGAYILSLIISGMPPLPTGAGFYRTWAYNALQILGASADKIVKHGPKFQQLEQTKVATAPDGTKTETSTSLNTKIGA